MRSLAEITAREGSVDSKDEVASRCAVARKRELCLIENRREPSRVVGPEAELQKLVLRTLG